MRTVYIVAILAVLFACMTASVEAGKCDAPVCVGVIGKLKKKVKGNDRAKIEDAVQTFCDKAKGKEASLCYEIAPMRKQISQLWTNGLPDELICQRLGKSNDTICGIRYPIKIDLSKTDLNKMRVKELKQILAEHGETCRGCTEKSEYVKKVRDILTKDEL
eukprot:TRINITY_DN5842_c0_g1_i2.p2 TRINITY_DN5842_c0_g1~~TRINITY_DN5842_c0_g1_i2.p2  ORF type:complete len:161 (-),score=49.49 TRINITY_DN5842_c0_g1_i2:190-672(-)